MTNPSDTYYKALEMTKRHHAGQTKTFSGQFTWKMRHNIKEIIDRYDVHSILDYGCGKGKQYQNIDPDTNETLEQYWGIETVKYDPGVRRYSTEPTGKFDLVICVQVLGSIPFGDLDWVVDRLYDFSNKAVFVSERIKLPRKQIYSTIVGEMPYGLTREQWMDILRRYGGYKQMIFAAKKETWIIEEINKFYGD